MALYSSSLKTHLVDAVRDIKKRRVEFRLDKVEAVYTSNIRILNVGVSGAGNYNILLGGLGIIRSIQLLDGNVVLDKIDSFGDYASFKHQLKTNDDNRDINSEEIKNALGFKYASEEVNVDKIMPEFEHVAITADDNYNASAFHLSKYLNFLKEARILPTQIFENLRIVIDYTTDYSSVSDAVNTVTTTNEPVLVIDEITDEQQVKALVSQFKEVQWEAIEHDMVYLDGTVNANVNYTIKGFDGGKLVNRLIVQRKPQTQPNASVGRVGSTAMAKLKEQFVVNGRNKLPGFNGIEDNNERLALLVDTFGEFNIVPAGNQVNYDDSSNVMVGTTVKLIGNQSYTGLVIGERVEEIQYQMNRAQAVDAIANATNSVRPNDPHNINFFGEVSKGLVVKGPSSYDIVYM